MKHPHSTTPQEQKEQSGKGGVQDLVTYTFHLAAKLYGWNKQQRETEYHIIYDSCVATIPDYKDKPLPEQKTLCAFAMLHHLLNDETLNRKPESKQCFTHGSWIV